MSIQEIKEKLANNSRLLLSLSIFGYIVIFSAISLWKYNLLKYNALDLAIINQAFYNSIQGNWFHLTIHPGSYLGDHLELIIFLLAPFYKIFPDPRTLLVLQSMILGLSAWPIYLIARQKLSANWSLLISWFFLANPLSHNINLFEFHLLPFAIFFLLFAGYFWQKKRLCYFLIFIILALITREDASLVVVMFGILAFGEGFLGPVKKYREYFRRNWQWIVIPIILGLGYFIFSMKIISHYSLGGEYKFLYYYSHLGNSFGGIIKNIFIHPFDLIRHLIKKGNLAMILGFLAPVMFLPVFRPKYLLLVGGVSAQIMLGAPGGGDLILNTHYASLFLPGLWLAAIAAISAIINGEISLKFLNYLNKERPLLLILLVVTAVYSEITMGPLPAVGRELRQHSDQSSLFQVKKEFLAEIPPAASLAATYEFLTPLSSRPEIYAMNYVYINKSQYAAGDYPLPDGTNFLLIDFADFITYNLQFPDIAVYAPYYSVADDHLREVLRKYGLIKIKDTMALFAYNKSNSFELYQNIKIKDFNQEEKTGIKIVNQPIGDQIELDGYKLGEETADNLWPITLYFHANSKIDNDYQLLVESKNNLTIKQFSRDYPLAYGIYPTSEWQLDEIIKINYWFLLPNNLKIGDLTFSLVKLKGGLELNGIRSTYEVYNEVKKIGSFNCD